RLPVTAGELERDSGSVTDRAFGRILRPAHACVLEEVLELPDARLVAPLVLFGGVVPAVLLEVALFAGQLDRFADLRPGHLSALGEFLGQPVVGVLCQPMDLLLGHGVSSSMDRPTGHVEYRRAVCTNCARK